MVLLKLQNRFKKIPWRTCQHLIGILLGAMLVAISINTLVVPNHIADGGLTGVAIILHYLFHWPVSMIVLILNMPLFVIAFKFVGRKFFIFSVAGVSGLSLALSLTGHFPALTTDTLLAAIYGGVLTGVGMGLIFRSRGSLGGTDILAVLFSRTTSLSVGQILLAVDAVIFIVTAILFRPEVAMYAIIYMFIATRVVDFVQEGLSHSKAVMVVTQDPLRIADEIMSKLERGVTLFNAIGGFSGQVKQVVYCVVSRTELSQIKEIVHERDPRAFMAISEVPEVVGEGFSSWKGH